MLPVGVAANATDANTTAAASDSASRTSFLIRTSPPSVGVGKGAGDRARRGEILRERTPEHEALLLAILAEEADALRPSRARRRGTRGRTDDADFARVEFVALNDVNAFNLENPLMGITEGGMVFVQSQKQDPAEIWASIPAWATDQRTYIEQSQVEPAGSRVCISATEPPRSVGGPRL